MIQANIREGSLGGSCWTTWTACPIGGFQAKQCCASFRHLDQEPTSRGVMVHERFLPKGLLKLIQLDEFHSEGPLQKLIAVELERTVIQRRVHFRN